MKTIIIITYESGKKSFVPRTLKSLDHILSNFNWIEDLEEISTDESYFEYLSSKDEEKDFLLQEDEGKRPNIKDNIFGISPCSAYLRISPALEIEETKREFSIVKGDIT